MRFPAAGWWGGVAAQPWARALQDPPLLLAAAAAPVLARMPLLLRAERAWRQCALMRPLPRVLAEGTPLRP
jgi:hypothetical protein